MNFREVGQEYNVEVGEVKIRPYIKIGEISSITQNMLQEEDQIQREIIKVVGIVLACTNIEPDRDDKGVILGQETYDMVVANRDLYNVLLYGEIVNIDTIDDIIKSSESTYKIAEDFVSNLNKSLKNFDMKKIQDGFKGLGGAINGNDNRK